MQTATLMIPAMTTEAIAVQVAKALEQVDGVGRVHITLAHTLARVGFDETRASQEQLRGAVTMAGFIVAEKAKSSCCGSCGGA